MMTRSAYEGLGASGLFELRLLQRRSQLEKTSAALSTPALLSSVMAAEEVHLRASKRPLWRQIAGLLESAISDANLPSGTRLPGEEDLAEIFHTSRETTKRALNALCRAGIVVRHQGKGTFVRLREVPATPSIEIDGAVIFQEEQRDRRTRMFRGALEDVTVLRLEIDAGGDGWTPNAHELTVASVFGPAPPHGIRRTFRLSAGYDAQLEALALRVVAQPDGAAPGSATAVRVTVLASVANISIDARLL